MARENILFLSSDKCLTNFQSDILFPVEQQREVADALRMAGNSSVVYYELGGVWGHDTFLIDVMNVGGAIRGFLA